MARRSDHNREELYDLILDAASDIVKKDGFRALTARNVANAVGYSAGTLYNLFSNIDDLIVHLNGRTLDQLNDQLLRVKLSGNAKMDVAKLAESYLRYLKKQPALWELLFEFKLPENEELPDWYQLKIGAALAVLENALSPLFKGNKKGAQESARVLWASFHGICSLASTGKLPLISDRSVSEMMKLLIENYLNGIDRKGGSK